MKLLSIDKLSLKYENNFSKVNGNDWELLITNSNKFLWPLTSVSNEGRKKTPIKSKEKNIESIICLFEKYSLFLKYVEMLKMRKTGKRAFLKPVSKTLVK